MMAREYASFMRLPTPKPPPLQPCERGRPQSGMVSRVTGGAEAHGFDRTVLTSQALALWSRIFFASISA